jgi:hypothetical protein
VIALPVVGGVEGAQDTDGGLIGYIRRERDGDGGRGPGSGRGDDQRGTRARLGWQAFNWPLKVINVKLTNNANNGLRRMMRACLSPLA